MNTKETKLRIEPALDEWLASQAAIAGMAKTKYIIQLLATQRLASQHTDPKLSPKVSPESPADASLYAEVAALKLRVAKLEQTIPNTTLPIPKSIPSFEKGQVITGQQSKLYNLLHNSKEVHQHHNKLHYYLSNKLGIIFYQYGESKAGAVKYGIAYCFPGEQVVLDAEGKFFTTAFTGELGWFTESELAAMAEAKSDVKPASNEIAIEDIGMTPTPTIKAVIEDKPNEAVEPSPSTETLTLDRAALVQRMAKTPGEAKTFAATLTSVGGSNNKASNILDWTSKHDPEGKSWLPTDETRQTWVCQSSVAV